MNRIYAKLKAKQLTFPIALIWIIVAWIAVFSLPSHFAGNYLDVFFYQFKAAGLITINILIALFIEDEAEPFERVFTQIWRIKILEKNPQLALSMIIDALNASNELWVKITERQNLFKELQNKSIAFKYGILTREVLIERSIAFWKRIVGGKITILQVIWLYVYMYYTFVISTNLMKIFAPYDLLISLAFFLILTFTNDTEGLGEFLQEVYTSLTSTKPEDLEHALKTLETRIIRLARDNYLVQNAIDLIQKRLKIEES